MKIFISHAALDGELAELIERQILLADPSVEVFRTTRLGQIPAGREWLSFIQANLRDADAYLVLLTPWSMQRPWIAFETGAAWYSGKTLVPVVVGNLDKGAVVEPLRSLQLLSLESPAEAGQAFAELGISLGAPDEFASAAISLCAKASAQVVPLEEWEGSEFSGTFYAWAGPLEDLRESTPRPAPKGLIEHLRESGLQVTSGVYGDLHNEFSKGYLVLWQVDRKRRRRHLVLTNIQCLLVKPAIRLASA